MSKLHRHLHRLAGRPREPRPRSVPTVVADKTTPVVLPPVRDRWDVVMLSPAANEGTLASIDAAGFDVWRPRAVVLVSSATQGKAVYVNRPLWPRYARVRREPGHAPPRARAHRRVAASADRPTVVVCRVNAHILTGGELTTGRRKPSDLVAGVPAGPAESGTNINTIPSKGHDR
jgi:hypothetical protein